MKINLENVTCRDSRVSDRLKTYCRKIEDYPNFNPEQKIQVFVSSGGDFTAFESTSYMLSFVSTAHKISETIKSELSVDPVPYVDFRVWVNRLNKF